jgi:predicted glycoside hydrolase/deacetylase ChbG (UPF0249 family)
VLLSRLARGQIDAEDVRRELTAQLDRIEALGRPLTHVDTHQHLHLWPAVGAVVLALAAERGIPAVRVPRAQRTALTPAVLNLLAGRLERRADAAGIRYPAATAGFDVSGELDRGALERTLDALVLTRAASAELLTHPGEAVDPARVRYRWGYRWSDELDALTGAGARDAVARRGFVLGSYASLPVG